MAKLRSSAGYWLLAAVWMALIFTGSGDGLSFKRSSTFLGPMLHFLMPWLSEEGLHTAMFVVRKCGHATEYGVLALLFWLALRKTPGDGLQRSEGCNRPAQWAFVLATLYAITDELHQAFVPSRQGSVIDVLIDAAGAGVALVLLHWTSRRLRQR